MAVQLRGIAQDAVVEYFYLNFMSYQWHLYVSIMLLVANLGVQLCVALLEMLGAQVRGTRYTAYGIITNKSLWRSFPPFTRV